MEDLQQMEARAIAAETCILAARKHWDIVSGKVYKASPMAAILNSLDLAAARELIEKAAKWDEVLEQEANYCNPMTLAEVTAWLREQRESRCGSPVHEPDSPYYDGLHRCHCCGGTGSITEDRYATAADLIDTLTAERDGKEVCICSAVKSADGLIMRGQRHHDCIRAMRDRNWSVSNNPELQGFMTSRNRFVSRAEALALQKEAGIRSAQGEYRNSELFSEDLY